MFKGRTAKLTTGNKALQEIMIREYPGILRSDQCEKEKIGYRKKRYTFKELDENLLLKLLVKYPKIKDYEIECHTNF
jgi:hypothetical protein